MRTIILLLTFCFTVSLQAQTDGITYQAVIIDNNPQEIPGVDVPSNNLPNTDIKVRFSIINHLGNTEYQEIQSTTTDPFGMINLTIGRGEVTSDSSGEFTDIYWNEEKYLKVEIDLNNGIGMVEFSRQELTYLPYVKHREIIATSTLDVDGATNLNSSLNVNNQSLTQLSGQLTVDGISDLNSNLTVLNQSPTYLTGDLTVDGLVSFDGPLEVGGDTQLYADLTVDGITNLNNTLNVNNGATTNLSGDLNVGGTATFSDGVFENITVTQNSDLNTLNVSGISTLNNTLTVNSLSNLNGQVTIDADLASNSSNYNNYPLRVQGSRNGIAIKTSSDNPNENNNFITFIDGDNDIRGRIEAKNDIVSIATGLIYDLIEIPDFGDIIDADGNDEPADVEPNQYFYSTYAFGAYQLTFDLVVSVIRFGINAAAASGLCVAGDCDDAVWSFIDIVADGIQLGGYITYNEINMGVAFESGGADYAEWLKKYNIEEVLSFGDVVGVKGGFISKTFVDANQFMVISKNPMVSGAMPDKGEEYKFEKVAFLGQVPVKVIGDTSIGDYIVASGNKDGFAIAIAPEDMLLGDYSRIVGVAWSASTSKAFNYIQTAVGINTNDLVPQIAQIQGLLNIMQQSLAKLDSNYKPQLYALNSALKTANGNTEAPTISEQLMSNGKGEYQNLKEALKDVSKLNNPNSGFDIMKMPYIKEMIKNPSKELSEKMVVHYTKVLQKLEYMQDKAKLKHNN